MPGTVTRDGPQKERNKVGVSKNCGTPKIMVPHFNRVFHHKPSILGVPQFLETPKSSNDLSGGGPAFFRRYLDPYTWAMFVFQFLDFNPSKKKANKNSNQKKGHLGSRYLYKLHTLHMTYNELSCNLVLS